MKIVVGGGYEVRAGTAREGIAVLSPTTAAPGDIDVGGVVGILDFLAVPAAWGPYPPSCAVDFDGDCAAGINDFLLLLENRA